MKTMTTRFVLLMSLALEAAAVSLREFGTHRLRIIPTKDLPLPGVEEKERKHKQRVMDAITKFRAEVCAEMKDEHGKSFESYEACNEFMMESCKPGKDHSMDGDSKEVTSKEGFCKEYFPKAKKKADEEVKRLEKEDEEKEKAAIKPEASEEIVGGPAPGPALLAPAPAPTKKAAAPEAAGAAPAGAAPGPAPMVAPAGAPGPAPVPAPFIPGKSEGKPWGPIPKDEAWYYKKDGKDIQRLHMHEGSKLPTQGYWGKLVGHDDGETSTGDWGREFGPRSGHRSVDSVCEEHPESAWCTKMGFGRSRSSCFPVRAQAIVAIIALIFPSVVM